MAGAVVAGMALASAPSQAAPAAKTTPAKAVQGAAYGRAVAAMPDWNGVWQTTSGLVFDPVTAEKVSDGFRGSDFGTPGGTFMRPPYNAEWQAKYDAIVRETAAGRARDPTSDCRVEGFPRLHQVPTPVEIVVLPKVVFMTWAYFDQTRRIYTDGRPHPPRDTAYPRELGHSVGHWEGHTLVVDTVDMVPFIYDQTEAPYSEQIHVVERYRVLDSGVMEVELVIDDPVAFTKPWRVVRQFKRMAVGHKDPSRPGRIGRMSRRSSAR